MGLKCSVLGHRFEEPGLVHEREQSGDEVIIIKRKVRVCTLCGEQRVLAESKEITKQANSDTDSGEDDATDDRNGSVSAVTHDSPESESTGFAGVDTVYDDTTMDDDGESTVTDLRRTDDDGVILTEDDTDTGREYGEWPTESCESESEMDSSWDPDVVDTPSQPSDTETQSADTTATDDETDDGKIIETTDESIDETTDARSVEKKTLSCHTCDFSVIAADSPFRSGDICPGCHESYLTDGV